MAFQPNSLRRGTGNFERVSWKIFRRTGNLLQRMTEGHPMSRLDELLPWNWPKIGVKH
jgi:hypothetical protein